jgi:hypothetical protein
MVTILELTDTTCLLDASFSQATPSSPTPARLRVQLVQCRWRGARRLLRDQRRTPRTPGNGILTVENLTNVEALLSGSTYSVSLLLLNFEGCDGSPIRIIACAADMRPPSTLCDIKGI